MPDLAVWPTDGAAGAVSSEAQWRKMARLWVPSGVDPYATNRLAPTLAAGPTINVATGAAWVDGHYAELASPASVPASANGLLVLRFTPADNRCELLYRDGATVPTQTVATWELPIARMAAGALADVRRLVTLGGNVQVPTCILSTTAAAANTAAQIAVPYNAAGEVMDTDAMHDGVAAPTVITFKTPGVYLVTCTQAWQAAAAGCRWCGIIAGGATLAADRRPATAANPVGEGGCSVVWPFSATESVTHQVFQDSGSALALSTARFSATYLGPTAPVPGPF